MNKDIAIVYESDDILAINKPAGLLVHGDGKERGGKEPTVVDWLLEHYPEAQGVGEEAIATQEGGLIDRSGIVHRLDRDTSGVMLLAKTARGHEQLKAQFQERSIGKVYQALVYGSLKYESYEVDAPIGRSRTFARWSAIPKALRGEPRAAHTTITVVQRLHDEDRAYTLVEARPTTGRTHQIRVHLQYLNYPIVADMLYAGKCNKAEDNLGLERQALHASQISFTDTRGARQTVGAPLASDMRQAIASMT